LKELELLHWDSGNYRRARNHAAGFFSNATGQDPGVCLSRTTAGGRGQQYGQQPTQLPQPIHLEDPPCEAKADLKAKLGDCLMI
jgi:hypothetical protein